MINKVNTALYLYIITKFIVDGQSNLDLVKDDIGFNDTACLQCPQCGSDQAVIPVLYFKPNKGHIQLAK